MKFLMTNPCCRLPVLVLLLVGLGACSWLDSYTGPYGRKHIEDADLVRVSYHTADQLLRQVPWLRSKKRPVIAATIVNINALEDSSALGRMLTEQISSRFAQDGVAVVEMKMRHDVFIKERAGEFMLSRSVREISHSHDAAAVLAGTYAVGKNSVYVNARLIRAADNRVVAAYDFRLPLGPDTKAMLGPVLR